MGTAFGGVKGRSALPGLVEDYRAGKLPLDDFITHRFSGAPAIMEAVHLMEDPSSGALRPVITL